jgi:hypothetical protein
MKIFLIDSKDILIIGLDLLLQLALDFPEKNIKQNPPDFSEGFIYMDGLVSTGTNSQYNISKNFF